MTITFQTKSGEFSIEVGNDGETILFAGLTAGLTLPYECATGTCGTCRARLMSGEADFGWPEAPGAERLNREKGDILMCQTRTRQSCLLRVPAHVVMEEENQELRPRRFNGCIENLRRLTPDVIDFEVALGGEIEYAAGQFLVVTGPGTTGGRAYSMVDYQPGTDRVRFVVKHKPGGGFTDWLFGGDASGSEISLFGPLGKATYRPGEDEDLLCITGGSGIAGIMSILKHATETGHFKTHKGWLFFGVRTLADVFYADELARLAERSFGNLRVTLALSHQSAATTTLPSSELISLEEGFVHEVAGRGIKEFVGNLGDNAIGFVAGPPPMVDGAIRILLSEAKIPAKRIRYDKFS